MKISVDVRDVSYDTSTTTANVDDGGNIDEMIQLFFDQNVIISYFIPTPWFHETERRFKKINIFGR